jgi:hypothetical protein
MKDVWNVGAGFGATIRPACARGEIIDAPRALYSVECIDAEGKSRWHDHFANMVVAAGKNDLLTQYFKGSAYTAAWHVGLVDNAGFSAIVVGDTMASHSGWTESTAYSNANRPALTFGAASGGSIDNSASVASFAINATATIRGAFVANNSAKGGSAGTLYSAGTFAANRSVVSGDTLNITVTLSAS